MGETYRRTCVLGALIALGACKFSNGAASDGVAPTGVGFQFPQSVTDETVHNHAVSVALAAPSTETVTVDVEIAGGTAAEGDDFTLLTSQLTFLPGEDRQDIQLDIVDDGATESDETIELRLGNAQNALIIHDSHTVTISNTPLPRIQFTGASSSALEGAGAQAATVTMDRTSAFDVTIGIGASGTATVLVDHDLPASGTYTITAGAMELPIAINVIDESYDEYDETIDLQLTAISGAVVVSGADAFTHTIGNDDPPPVIGYGVASGSQGEGGGAAGIVVTLTPQSGKPVQVDLVDQTGGAGAASPADYTLNTSGPLMFAAGVTEQTISVTPTADALDEPDETVSLHLQNPTNATMGTANYAMTITDDDLPPSISFDTGAGNAPEETSPYNAAVSLSAASGFDIGFSVNTANGTATGGDYSLPTSNFTIPAGQTTAVVPVTIVNDTADEPDETFTLNLTGLSNTTAGATTSHTVTIIDNDLPAVPVLSWNGAESDGSVAEGDPPPAQNHYDYHVVLNTASASNVTFTLRVGGSANGSDCDITTPAGGISCTNSSATIGVTMPAGQTSLTITVNVNRDNNNESDNLVTMTLQNPVGATLGTPAVRNHTILNDD